MASIDLHFKLTRPNFTLDAQFKTETQGVTALFGYSGSGKTTVLRCIAGLEKPEFGQLTINGTCWQSATTHLAPEKRPIGYVFQEANLFQHLSVNGNLDYAIKRNRRGSHRIQKAEVIEQLGLTQLIQRSPQALSGGQRQRVAIARALLTNPELLLMDEPLASLDLASKAEILPYLELLPKEFNIPIIYVSHSPDEVIRLADHLVLLDQGQVLATGPVNDILTATDLPLAQLDEACAAVTGTIDRHQPDYHLTYVQLRGGRVAISQQDAKPGTQVRVRISAKDVSLALAPQENSSITNAFPVRIADIQPARDPAKVLIKLDMGGEFFLAQITRLSSDTLQLHSDKIIYAQIKSVALMG